MSTSADPVNYWSDQMEAEAEAAEHEALLTAAGTLSDPSYEVDYGAGQILGWSENREGGWFMATTHSKCRLAFPSRAMAWEAAQAAGFDDPSIRAVRI